MNIEIESLESRLTYLKEVEDHLATCDKHKHESATLEVVKAEREFWEQVMLFPNFRSAYEQKFQKQVEACERSTSERERDRREEQWKNWLSHEGPVPWSSDASAAEPSSSSSSQ